ncbi:hypothetical protein GMA12_13290 [Kocuria sediminis]|uniref:Uncharacterized protein n=1 Tax=Kocuria sediminis TaxID=1038857 RepID=A0A6N8GP93_9MICC|nr:hypothetical protein [Kocuria sediminis]MUN64100.1 hypothetical protein [Kocuria sediminis]
MSARPGGTGPEDEWTEIVSGLEDVRRAGDRHLAGPRDWSPEDATPGGVPAEADDGPDDVPDDDAPYSPDPGPITQGLSRGALLSWAVLIGVPVLLLVLGLMPGSLPWWAIVAGLVAVVGAIVHLLTSLPEDRDDLDDGARV